MDNASRKTIIIISLFFLLGIIIGWGAGDLYGKKEASQIIIDKNIKIGLPFETGLFNSEQSQYNEGKYSASINGTVFYPIGCKAANRIKEENRIWFNSAEEAIAQGYKPAANCP